jgi:transcription elongation factor GreA
MSMGKFTTYAGGRASVSGRHVVLKYPYAGTAGWRRRPYGGSMKRIPVTPGGRKKMEQELEKLMRVDRPRNVRDIEEARSHGDLSENAEYHAAKERQAFIEGRIIDLKQKLARAEVIDPSRINHDRVAFGATVKVIEIENDREAVYTLVGADEADAGAGRISMTSPVGKALMGRRVGDEVVIEAPARTIEYEIVEISYV